MSTERSAWPAATSAVWAAAKAVSRVAAPNGARSNSQSFSVAVQGEWSEQIASIVPSTSAAMSARRSASSRRGGFVFRLVG
jgi:hypothetical protein